MRLPPDLLSNPAALDLLSLSPSPDGTLTTGFDPAYSDGAYPPPGYVPWPVLEVGNGDTYGFYWPLGMEDHPPIVCTILHDTHSLLPIASSIQSAVRLLHHTHVTDDEELRDVADALTIPLDDANQEDNESADGEAGGIEFWGAPSATDLLKLDPTSPHLRLLAARESLAAQDLPRAEKHLAAALNALPEYADAWAALAQLRRKKQDHTGAMDALMEALTCPHAFGAPDRRKLLRQLQHGPDADYADPLWPRRHDLAFQDHVKETDDYRVLDELVKAYHDAGMSVRAVRLRILAGERMARETVSFRERHDWIGAKHRTLLRTDLAQAGLHSRLPAVRA